MAARPESAKDGEWSKTTVGAPQGAVISPLLSNVYLHYVFDLWIEWWRNHRCRGDVVVVRYADDFVIGFEFHSEATACWTNSAARLRKFGLEACTKENAALIEFGRYAAESSQAQRGDRAVRKRSTSWVSLTMCAQDTSSRSVYGPSVTAWPNACVQRCRRSSAAELAEANAPATGRNGGAGCGELFKAG